MAWLIVFKSLIGCRTAEGCRVWLQGLAAGFGPGLARVWPAIDQGLAEGFGFRDWLQGCWVAGLLKI